jgi:anti-sigma B factor antagonist
MAVRHLEAEVRQKRGVVVLDLRGEINGFAQEALDAAYSEAESNDPEAILLNFEGVDYINSTGIALIVGLLAKARASPSAAWSLSASQITTWRSSTSRASLTL